MLRIDFSDEALLRTRFAPDPAPLMELGLGLATAQRRDVLFDQWRREIRPRLPIATRALFELIPTSGAGPVFLDPISNGLEDGLEQVRSFPQPFVSEELRRVTDAGGSITSWIRGLDRGDADAWTTLVLAIRAGYGSMIGPWWTRITAAYRTELALRARMFTRSGMAAVLGSLYPGSGWCGTTLEIPVASRTHIRTDSRGVTLMPSVLWAGRPLVATHTDGSLLVVYAAATPLALVDGEGDGDGLARLLGTNRAAVLTTALEPSTTTELARQVGISIASASAHASILRHAGLITTTRDGKAVVHAVTALGAQLLAV